MGNTAPLRQPDIDIPVSLAQNIVAKMYSVGDEMRAETRKNQYVTHNHDKSKFWDVLNTSLCNALYSPNCMSAIKRRGFWEFVLAFYKPSGLIFTFMREERFRTLQAEIRKRGRMTYVDMLVRHLNRNLLAPVGQTSFLPVEFSDEARLSERVQTLLCDFQNEDTVVGHYILVLFDCDFSYELRGVRAVLVDANLDIVDEISWSHLIPVSEATIVDQVTDSSAPSNQPSRGLTLKPKAFERKNREEKSPPRDIIENDDTTK